MGLVKLEIDGKRVIADSNQTILQVARENGIHSIPTLCHDEQLEPFGSCFLCVVKVKGARTLLPACSTKVAAGMSVQTGTPEVMRSRRAALELLLSNHYADCVGPCQLACPAGVDIQGYLALAALGKFDDALKLIKETNPLPAICGRICTRPCEVKGCRRSILDEAVGIDYVKRYIADLDLSRVDSYRPPQAPPNGKRVAVIGAGPAGLSCAFYLALKGYKADIFEALPEAGGMLRYGIPEYRLPKDVLDLEINQILDLGVTLSTNVALGRDFTIASLKKEGYEAIFVGLGAWDSTKMRVQGEEVKGVLPGIDFLKDFGLRKKIELPGTVLVIGGGNTAIDCARTALRCGAEKVKLLYRRTKKEMPANAMEIEEALHEGVEMEFLVAPTRVIQDNGRAAGLECLRMELGDPDASGRRSPRPIRGSEFQVPCDFILAAIGQGTRLTELLDGHVQNFLPFGETLNLTRWQTIQVNDQTFETSVEGVFSGGDVVTGAATAIEAIAAGRKAAYAIDKYITGGQAEPEPFEFISRKDTFAKIGLKDLRGQETAPRQVMRLITDEERKGTFTEVETGYTIEDLKKETARCLECGCVALFHCDLRRYATEYRVEVKSFLGEANQFEVDWTHPLIELDQNKCILCGRCVRMCSEIVGIAAYGYVNRGMNAVVRPALGGSLLETDCVTCGLCIGTCPTGAIAERVGLAKPGPWETRKTPTICHYCGVGCRLDYETYGDTIIKMARVEDNPVTYGGHCGKGLFGTRYLYHPERLINARIRPGRELQETDLEDGIGYAALRLKELSRRYSGDEVALFVSPRMTNEEIYLIQKLARVGFRTHNVGTMAQLVNREHLHPGVVSTASYRDLVDAQTILLINARPAEEQFVADLMIKRAVRQGARLIVIGPDEGRTPKVAEVFLRCTPGTENQVLLGVLKEFARVSGTSLESWPELTAAIKSITPDGLSTFTGVRYADVEQAGTLLAKTLLKVVVFNKDFRGPRVAGDEPFFAAASKLLGASVLALREKANMQGLMDMGAHPDWLPGYIDPQDEAAVDELEKEWCVVLRDLPRPSAPLHRLLADKKIKLALVFGEDPFGDETLPEEIRKGLLACEFLLVGDLFMTPTARSAHVVLPLSAHGETRGTLTSMERRVQVLNRAATPKNGLETWQILCQLAAKMGFRFRFKYADAAEITAEIHKVLPIYRNVVPGSTDSDGLWDLSRFPMAGNGQAPLPAGKPETGTPTLFLDPLERRFEDWFRKTLDDARAKLTP